MSSTPLQMRRRRVRLIRRRVVGGATALFVASSGWIFAELVSGHDPALARQANTHSTTTSTSVASSSPTAGSSSSSNSSGSSSSGSATAVTTSAS